MSDLQTDSRMWATIEGTLSSEPHRARTGLTLRAKLLAQDAKGNWVRVRLVIRRGDAYDCMNRLATGARVRVVGQLALSDADNDDSDTKSHLWMDVDSAVRLEGAERTKHSIIERLTDRLKFWSANE
ncbi:hypothetical protein [Paraburkholderia phenoliruptrix]|uniref:hypothetical protein n=1 Tax=Paraburkholderia phenoliruptrix TaxID=252970 RepID=UPI001C4E7B68|nr:hypothetical protein [Paraburkholderia phenoliruptrix]MBW0449016.1 hypothetical protein [Paraburkholderia phenoliruptrix]MBW9097425.1 hypothetical protein [Paraburkholderia phenoliruptrix]